MGDPAVVAADLGGVAAVAVEADLGCCTAFDPPLQAETVNRKARRTGHLMGRTLTQDHPSHQSRVWPRSRILI